MTAAGQEHVWQRGHRWWHAAFAALCALALVLVLLDPDPHGHRSWAVVAVLALLAFYAAVGRPAMSRCDGWLELLAAGGTIALVVAGIYCQPVVAVTLFVVYPHLFAWLTRLRQAIAAVVLLTVGVALAQIGYAGWSAHSAAVAGASGAVALLFALAFGIWIARIIDQSAERAAIIAELQSTRDALAAANHDAGVLVERQRLAYEIHDTLAQGFTSLLMLVQAADREITDIPAARQHLALAERTARANLAEARSMVAALAPPALDGVPLQGALRGVIDTFSHETGMAAQLSVEGVAVHLPSTAEVVLLRTVQEALTNVRRHSGATSVVVRLSYVDGRGAVQVTDDGSGFDPTAATGFGLRGMRSRVEEAGGAVSVHSAPGLGTTVTVSLP